MLFILALYVARRTSSSVNRQRVDRWNLSRTVNARGGSRARVVAPQNQTCWRRPHLLTRLRPARRGTLLSRPRKRIEGSLYSGLFNRYTRPFSAVSRLRTAVAGCGSGRAVPAFSRWAGFGPPAPRKLRHQDLGVGTTLNVGW